MTDPLRWSLPLGRVFGITVRVHILFPVVALGLILRVGSQEGHYWNEAFLMMVLLFFSVLLHEFGHCFGARLVEGDAHEILLWPLGGLAYVEVPHTPRANFLTAAAGPAVNLLLCLTCALALASIAVRPPFSPFWPVPWTDLVTWEGTVLAAPGAGAVFLARVFWINWVLFLLNVVLIGFPLDGGRMFQAALWPRFGFRQATMAAVFAGFITTLIVAIYSFAQNDTLALFLALFIYVTCRHQWILLETGAEESLFGYDFSQGYTSLEREQPRRPRRQSFWQRWLQRRAARKLQREQEQREAEEQRMDELLEKVHRLGQQALTEEERRFLTRVSARYRNR